MINFAFDSKATGAVQAASKSAAKMVSDITDETEKNLRVLITQAIKSGESVYDAAAAIHDMIGLTSAQGQAVDKYRQQLEDNGLNATAVDEQVSEYSDELLTSRAETIARSEIMHALNTGQDEAWQQAQDEGVLTEEATKEWILDEDACDECVAAAEQDPVPIGDSFDAGDPPLHPRCRCTIGIATP